MSTSIEPNNKTTEPATTTTSPSPKRQGKKYPSRYALFSSEEEERSTLSLLQNDEWALHIVRFRSERADIKRRDEKHSQQEKERLMGEKAKEAIRKKEKEAEEAERLKREEEELQKKLSQPLSPEQILYNNIKELDAKEFQNRIELQHEEVVTRRVYTTVLFFDLLEACIFDEAEGRTAIQVLEKHTWSALSKKCEETLNGPIAKTEAKNRENIAAEERAEWSEMCHELAAQRGMKYFPKAPSSSPSSSPTRQGDKAEGNNSVSPPRRPLMYTCGNRLPETS